MRERSAGMTAAEVAREHLCLLEAGPAAEKLVRAILSKDERFEEPEPGRWRLAPAGGGLRPPVVVAALEAPEGARTAPWLWRIGARLWGGREPAAEHCGIEATPDLGRILAWFSAHPVAVDRPGQVRRWMGAIERLHAVPELDPVVLDLRAWQRLLGERAPTPECGRSVHARPGETGTRREVDRPETLEEVLDAGEALAAQVLEAARARGLGSWRDVALAPEIAEASGATQAWGEGWAFTPADLAAVPPEPGIYRFHDAAGKLLYVGKARNLHDRVGSYFRPLEDGSARRAAFLAEVHRLETEVCGTELEALLREAEEIRTQQPSWNVQIQLMRTPSPPAPGEEDLVFLVPRFDGAHSLFALGGERAARSRIDAACDWDLLKGALRDFYVEGATGTGLSEVPPPERLLLRRWIAWGPAEVVLLRLTDFATFSGLIDALRRAASVCEGTADLPVVVRERPCEA